MPCRICRRRRRSALQPHARLRASTIPDYLGRCSRRPSSTHPTRIPRWGESAACVREWHFNLRTRETGFLRNR
jgi:hypothetical protein